MFFQKLKRSIAEQRAEERSRAEIEKQGALLEYAKSKGTNKEKYERYYNAGWYNEKMLWNMVLKNKITADDYEEITGKKHEDEA